MKRYYTYAGASLAIVMLLSILSVQYGHSKTTRKKNGSAQRFEFVVQKGHLKDIMSVRFHPGGRLFASCSQDHTIKLWNSDGRLLRTLTGHTHYVNALSWAPGGKYLASASYDKTVRLWSLSGKLLYIFRAHSGSVEDVAFSPDGKSIASSSLDGTVKIWNKKGYFIRSIQAHKSHAMCLAFSPDGRYIAEGGSDERAGLWTVEGKNIFRTKKTGSFVEAVAFSPDGLMIATGHNVYINDVPLYGSPGKKIYGRKYELNERLELMQGKNKIEVSCINAKGAESYRALTFARYDSNEKGDLYFIGFGVSDYKNNDLDLGYAHQDVLDLGRVFKSMEGRQFNNVISRTYTDNDVTVDNIRNARKLLFKANTDDTVIVFIAGHGMHARGKKGGYYYLTHDTDIDNISGTAAPFELIENLLQGIKPRKKLFLMDTCESGELDAAVLNRAYAVENSRGVRARTIRKKGALKRGFLIKRKKRAHLLSRERFIYNDLFRRSGAIVLSSCRGDEVSYEHSSLKNGLFTEAIIKGLTGKGADRDSNGIVSTDELRDYVSEEVPRLCRGLNFTDSHVQHPVVDRDNLYIEFGFPITD